MKNIISFVAGMIFAVGLVISGMTDPEIVIGFLDIFGSWNYSLGFVMVGAVVVNLILFRYILKRKKPIFENDFSLPNTKIIDKDLVIGSILFGIGWGLVGICPGPAIVNLVTFSMPALIFFAAMIFGMLIYKNTHKS